jgi:predicted RNA-binding protein with PUA-like domain
MAYWLLKTEPEEWSWDMQVKKGVESWTGVRNFMAARNLRAMKAGERAFFYHTGDEKRIVGVVEVVKTAYRDPTDETGKFVAVDIKTVMPVKTPVTLAAIKADARFKDFLLVRQSRLSVVPVPDEHWRDITRLAGIA